MKTYFVVHDCFDHAHNNYNFYSNTSDDTSNSCNPVEGLGMMAFSTRTDFEIYGWNFYITNYSRWAYCGSVPIMSQLI